MLRRRWSKGLDEDSHLVDEPKKNQRIGNMSQRLRCEYAVFLNIFSGKPSVILIVF